MSARLARSLRGSLVQTLRPRELQIVKLLAEGVDSNAEIAKRLNIELQTAKIHPHNIYIKVGLNLQQTY